MQRPVGLSSKGQLCITVLDYGQGLTAEEAPQVLGIVSIQEYAEAVGGDWVVRSAPGGGTEAVATLLLAGQESLLANEARI